MSHLKSLEAWSSCSAEIFTSACFFFFIVFFNLFYDASLPTWSRNRAPEPQSVDMQYLCVGFCCGRFRMMLHHFSLSLSTVLPFGICSPAAVCFFVCLFFLVPLCVLMHEFLPADGHEKRATARRENKPWGTTRRKPEKQGPRN